MSDNGWIAAIGATVMVSTTAVAASLIWAVITDPMGLALATAATDVPTLLATLASRLLALPW